MSTQLEQRARRFLGERWNEVKSHLGRLNMPDPRPGDEWAIFSPIEYPKTAGEIGFEVKPVTFNLPERANARTARANARAELFVVACGRLYFDEAAVRVDRLLRTVNFSTEVAYFRRKGDILEHVYGAHYDFAPNVVGHPAFHAQMRSFAERYHPVVNESFHMTCASTDMVDGILRNVRLPSAQMDFFSIVLQVCADHLIDRDSGQEELTAFGDLKTASAEIQGAAFSVPRFASPAVQACLRANHWYP